MGKTGFMKSYEEFIDALLAQSPDSRLIIQSILPVSKAYAQKDPRMANDTIDWYNQQLLKLAEEKNLYYLDTAQALKGADNNLDPRFDKGDGRISTPPPAKQSSRISAPMPSPIGNNPLDNKKAVENAA